MVKGFQNVSIQKKIIKSLRTHYKKKVLSPKFFSKKSKLDPQFWPKVFKFSKNGHFAPKMAKIAKNTKLSKFLCQFWKVWNGFLKKIPESKKLYFIILFPFFTFFLYYEHPKGTKNGTKHDHPLVFKKRLMQKVLDLLLNAINVAKKFSNIFFST